MIRGTISYRSYALGAMAAGTLALASSPVFAQANGEPDCEGLPNHDGLRDALTASVGQIRTDQVGLGNDMWGSVVNRDGVVCAVVFTGDLRSDQWPGSRVISAQKANTANAFSLEGEYPNAAGVGRALSTGNLYGVVLEQGSLFGLQFSNPVDTAVAYGDDPGDHKGSDAEEYGTENDPMIGQIVGGVNVFGGGLALYNEGGVLLGAVGVSGDTSCADHIHAWRVRDALGLDNIPGGVGPNNSDNVNLVDAGQVVPNSFQHPECGFGEETIINGLVITP